MAPKTAPIPSIHVTHELLEFAMMQAFASAPSGPLVIGICAHRCVTSISSYMHSRHIAYSVFSVVDLQCLPLQSLFRKTHDIDGGTMQYHFNLPNRFALILDPDTIESVVKRAEKLDLPRRECHPLDRYNGRRANADLAKYDAEVDAAAMTEEELESVDALTDTASAPSSAESAEDGDDKDF